MAVIEEDVPKANDALCETTDSFIALLQDAYCQSLKTINKSEAASLQKEATVLLNDSLIILTEMTSELKVRPRDVSAR